MEMLLIYYNPNHNCFYFKTVNQVTNYNFKVDYVNQFGHFIVQILYVDKNDFINCKDYWDYIKKSEDKQESKRNKLINGLIHLLYKLKKE